MFAFVKKLFRRSEVRPVTKTQAAQPTAPPANPFTQRAATGPVPAVSSAVPKVVTKAEISGVRPNNRMPGAPDTSFGTPTKKSFPVPTEAQFSKETIDLPLKQLWPKLSPELVRMAATPPKSDSLLRLPLNLVQAHLARGAMKIPLAQFRQFAPEGMFNGTSDSEFPEINIPISDILSRLSFDQLPRRAEQKKLEVPEDIGPIFGPTATTKSQLRIAADKTKAQNSVRAQPVAVPAPLPVPAISPAAPTPIPEVEESAPRYQPAPQPEPISSEPLRAPNLDPSLATLRPPPAVAAGKPESPGAARDEMLTITLMDVAAFWAERGKIELENLYRHSLEVPMSALEAALKKGKVEFAWREVRPWVRLASGNKLPSIEDETKVEFPLAWIAPRVLEQQRKSAPKKRVQVSEEIPDVFVRHVTPTVSADPPKRPEAPPEKEQGLRDYGEIFGQPEKKSWTLGEVSHRATSLPGVAGAIIATSDGLLVGGNWPGAGGETVAAFVPQMYTRMAGYSKELQLGEPQHFTLLIENVPLQIFKSADSYFTVLGRAGESLPARELNAIATRLAASLTGN